VVVLLFMVVCDVERVVLGSLDDGVVWDFVIEVVYD